MRNLCISLFIIVFISLGGLSQVNIDSLSHLNYHDLHESNLNDIWGYVDETGIEYALVGASKGTSVVSLEDPSNPLEVFWEPGMESIWRDLKTWGDYAYVTTEAENGLLVIDLSALPGSTALNVNYYNGEPGFEWSSAHNLYIDENGYAYIFGANRGNGGVIILDVHTDPMNPIEVGAFDNWYAHDGYVRNDTMYLAHIGDGFLSLVDITDKGNPILLGTKTTPSNFTHNIWPSDNSQFVFTTDELPGAYLAAYDVSDPLNIFEVDRIQSSPGANIIPHNVHVKGNFLVTSYYSDGVTIHDITYPKNMIQVGRYDTYPSQTSSYDGCWGVYPFLPSGLILAADITEGLFILSPDYQQAAYLEGLITEDGTGTPLDNVNVHIQGHDQNDLSNSMGNYGTGIVSGGNYTVEYSKVGYYPQNHDVVLSNAAITIKDVQLIPIPPYSLVVNITEAGSGNPIPDAQILLETELISHDGITNGIGSEDFTLYYQQIYRLTFGKWGYKTVCYDMMIDENTGSINIEMEKGYFDDFEFDFGWITSGNAETGNWERAVPYATSTISNPGFDAEYDCGKKAYVTGNAAFLHPDIDDVDGGTTVLISPSMDLSTYVDPYLNYAKWFYCKYGTPPLDSMKVLVSNGFTVAQVEITGHDSLTELTWVPRSIRLSDFLPITSTMQVIYRVSDLDPDVNITEGGLDYFFISDGNVSGIEEENTKELVVYPNPTSNFLNVKGLIRNTSYRFLDLKGRIIFSGELSIENNQISLENVSKGYYILDLDGNYFHVIKE